MIIWYVAGTLNGTGDESVDGRQEAPLGRWLWPLVLLLGATPPQDSSAFVQSGRAKLAVHDYQGALADFNQALKADPKNPDAFLARAQFRYETIEYDLAFYDSNQAVTLAPTDEYRFFRAQMQRARGQIRPALADIDDFLKKDPANAAAYRERGLCKSQMRNNKGAVADLDKALELDPKDAFALAQRARIRTVLKDAEGGEADLRKALELTPKYAMAYVWRAIARRDHREYSGAIEDCRKALEIDPRLLNAHVGLGHALRGKGDLAAAEASYAAALELVPWDQASRNARASVRDRRGNIEGALEDYTEALKLAPTAKRHWERGKIRLRMGELDDALADADHAVALDSSYTAWHSFRGRVLAARGDHVAAEREFTQAIALGAAWDDNYRNRAEARLNSRNFAGAADDVNVPSRNTMEKRACEEQVDFMTEYLGDVRGPIDGSWYVLGHPSPLSSVGRQAPVSLRRLEMDR